MITDVVNVKKKVMMELMVKIKKLLGFFNGRFKTNTRVYEKYRKFRGPLRHNLKPTPFSVYNEKQKKGLRHFFKIFENIFEGYKKLG